MNTRRFPIFVLAIITLFVLACSGGDDFLSVSKVASPDPTATPVSTSTEAPAEVPASTPVPATPTPSDTSGPDLSGFDITDMEGLMDEVMNSPELMGCLSSSMSLSSLMGLMGGDISDDQIEQITPCLSEIKIESLPGGLSGLIGSSDPAPTPDPEETPAETERPTVTTQTALVRPESVPWYDGPLFDSHTHMTGVTVSFFGGTYTTSDVLRLMDRHYIVGGVGFWLPPVMGRQSEIDLLNKSIGELDQRLATLMLPPPFDIGLDFAFMGFADGTYTTELLEPWFPPNGPFDGFGEIAFYTDMLKEIGPLDPQLDDVYPLVAASGGVVMAHPSKDHKAADWAEVMTRYPEITFLFHGIPDFHGDGPDERAAILELLETYEGSNMFYSIDAGPLMHAPEIDNGGSIGMDSENGEVLAALVDGYGRQRLAEHVYSEYSKEIIAYPDRLLFGTDFLEGWHFEDAGSDVIIDFARRFIGLLPEELQEDFAYKNGMNAFGKYLD